MLAPLPQEKEALIPIDLIKSLREDRVLALVGAGLSMPLGFPSWEKLIKEVFRYVESTSWFKDDKNYKWLTDKCSGYPDWVAEVLHTEQKESFRNALKDIFSKRPSGFSYNHALLSLLPFKGYVTTNYDMLIEEYLDIFAIDEPRSLDYEEASNSMSFFATTNRFVLKMHGCIKKSIDNWVLTSSDYYKVIHNEAYNRILTWIFSQHTLVTMGYSLRDKDFRTFIEERHHIFQKNCPPMYVIVGEKETCPIEVSTYYNKYNIQLVQISDLNNYAELTSLLFSLFCLVYRVDSSKMSHDIETILKFRAKMSAKFGDIDVELPERMNRALKLLSVFREPVDLEVFTTICTDDGLPFSPAHYRAISSATVDGKIGAKPKIETTVSEISHISQWLSQVLEQAPTGSAPRYLSTYHKNIFNGFCNTIYKLLLNERGWSNLIGDDDKSTQRLKTLNEYFRQQGKWKEWLEIANHGLTQEKEDSPIYLQILKTKLWVHFWTRDYDEVKEIVSKYPAVDDKEGESSYKNKMMYMNPDNLKRLVTSLSKESSLDYYNESLLGRAYARLSLSETKPKKKKELLEKAKLHLAKALEGAKRKNDLIETSVQSWYLACVHADLNEIDDAQKHLAEARRLDEGIMGRIPGIAWLRVAEYRFELKNPKSHESTKERKKEIAISAMKELGMIRPENFVENEYYY